MHFFPRFSECSSGLTGSQLLHFRSNRKSKLWKSRIMYEITSFIFRNFPIFDDFSTFLSTIGFEKSSNMAKFWQKNLRKSLIEKNLWIVNCLKCVDCLHGLTDLKNNYKTIINMSNTYFPKKYKCNNAKIIQTKVFHGL